MQGQTVKGMFTQVVHVTQRFISLTAVILEEVIQSNILLCQIRFGLFHLLEIVLS
jgi:hypothetical protein